MSLKKIQSALISVFYKDGLEPIVRELAKHNVTIYSTGGTETFINSLGISCVPVESVTGFPSILGGRVKTLHPKMFGGILGRRELDTDIAEMKEYGIPEIDLVIVDLYPFEETLKTTGEEAKIIEKIDIGGPSMIRAAAKNFSDLMVVASKEEYSDLLRILSEQDAATTLEQRKTYAAKAFYVVMNYDIAISNYFNSPVYTPLNTKQSLRYGENPHQNAAFYGELSDMFGQLNGKEISYNNLVDIDAAVHLLADFDKNEAVFSIIKHTNVCGLARRSQLAAAWKAALEGDPESAFGGVLACNQELDLATAELINELFFEVLIAPSYEEEALQLLRSKKNRILLQQKKELQVTNTFRKILNGTLIQEEDSTLAKEWNVVSGHADDTVTQDLRFANIAVKHLKSNAIALVKGQQLLGKGCGQTSRIDALKQAIAKARQFDQDLSGSVMASDAFFPFDDCVRLAHQEGVSAVIQPGGSIRDKDSIEYCQQNGLTMVITGSRHFKH